MPVADFTATDAAWVALAIFLVIVGIALAYALWRLGSMLRQVTTTVEHTETELLPVLNKTGGTLDRVNLQLDRADVVTESAAEAVLALDRTVRSVTSVVAAPIKGLAGLVEGVRYGFSSFRTNYSFGEAMDAGKRAAERRRRDLAEELGETPRPAPAQAPAQASPETPSRPPAS